MQHNKLEQAPCTEAWMWRTVRLMCLTAARPTRLNRSWHMCRLLSTYQAEIEQTHSNMDCI